MSHQATTWAFNAGSGPDEKRIGDTARKYLLVAMADHAHANGRNSFCHRATLADYLECDPKSITRYTQRLEADGFIRRGDQSLVSHIRGDRRPIVWDLAMNEATRARWEAAAAAGDSSWDAEQAANARRDNLSPRETGDEGTLLSPREDATGGQTRGQNQAHEGTPVSHRTQEPENQPPQPPASGGSSCARHPEAPAAGCRGCGTTQRQTEATEQRRRTEQRRADDAAALEDQRRRAGRIRSDPGYVDRNAAAAEQARQAARAAATERKAAG